MNDKLHKALTDEGPCVGPKDLMAYHDGRLEGDALRKVEVHLAHCELCSEAYDGILLSEVTPDELESDVAELNDRAWKRVEELSKPRSRRPILWMSAASVALVAIIGSWIWYASISADKKMEKVFAEQFTLPAADSLLIASSEAATDSVGVAGSGVVLKTLADNNGPKAEEEVALEGEVDRGLADMPSSKAYSMAEEELSVAEDANYLDKDVVTESMPNEQQLAENKSLNASGAVANTATPSRTEKAVNPKKSAEYDDEDEKTVTLKSDKNYTYNAAPTPAVSYAPKERLGNAAVVYDAVAVYDSVSAVVEPVRPPALVGGLGAYNAKDYRSAVKQFTEVLKDDPNHQEANFYAGVSYLGLEDASKAIPCLERAAKGANATLTENAEWYLALAYVKQKNRAKAEPILRKIEAKPSSPYKTRAADVLEDIERP